MRLGRGSQFPLISGLCGIAVVGAGSATYGGTCNVSVAIASGNIARSFCAHNSAAVSSPIRCSNHRCHWTYGEGAPGTSFPNGVLRRHCGDAEHLPSLSGIRFCGFNVCTDARCGPGGCVALIRRRDVWIAEKAWASLPTSSIPCHDEIWISHAEGLCTGETSLFHSTLARGPPPWPG
jgi:hypothetical protein